MNQAKRVILRLREADINWNGPYEAVRLYLAKNGRSTEELGSGCHFVHIQPPNPHIPQEDPKIHIIIDIEKDRFVGTFNQDFPHEMYRIRRVDNEMWVFSNQTHPIKY